MQVVEWKSQDFEPGLSEGGIYVLFTITFSTGNSDSLKKNLGLRKDQNEDIPSWDDCLRVS